VGGSYSDEPATDYLPKRHVLSKYETMEKDQKLSNPEIKR
jgi:hypothetical protein